MYNLIVSGTPDTWDSSPFKGGYFSGRFLEHTSDELKGRFEAFDDRAREELCKLPSLFAYEEALGKFALVGKITRISGQARDPSFDFEIDRAAPLLHLPSMRRELLIDEYELNRTHWAVKDADLDKVLDSIPRAARGTRVRGDANQVALRVCRAILDAAEDFDIIVGKTTVSLKVDRLPARPWPGPVWGLTERDDGPWPQAVRFHCVWEGGSTDIVASAELAGGKYENLVSLLVAVRLNSQMLVWINVAVSLKDGVEAVQFKATYSLAKRIPAASAERERLEKRRAAVRALVAQTELPRPSDSSIEAFAVELPKGNVLPSAKIAARRLAHLALLKLPFWTTRQADVINGTPYVESDPANMASLGVGPLEIAPVDAEDPEESEEDSATAVAGADLPNDPVNWHSTDVELRAEDIERLARERKLELAASTIAQVCAALCSGKHVMLVGPPGTGKSELAVAVASAACEAKYCTGLYVATASADWTSFDTIGGYAMSRDGAFAFRSGAFLRAIEQRKWLLFDEINRADVDRCFGELLTVLSGGSADTAFTLEDGAAISIGPGAGASHRIPKSFRVIATMNTWDKTSLFRLSYAVQRRFAVIHLGPPDQETYARIIRESAMEDRGHIPSLPKEALTRLQEIFDPSGLLAHRAIGPATAIDMVRYQRSRNHQDGLAEAVVAFLLPQLVGIDRAQVKKVEEELLEKLRGWSSTEAISEFEARMRELFPISTGIDP